MNSAALNRTTTHDGDFDDEVVKGSGLHARQHAQLRPRPDLKNTDHVGLRIISYVSGSSDRMPCISKRSPRCSETTSSVRRMADSMPSASTSYFQ